MDYRRFLQCLSDLYEGWGADHVRPKDGRFADILSDVGGLTTPSVMQLLNAAVASLTTDEIYCEVGTHRGATLIGALAGHDRVRAIAIDNFSQFDPDGSMNAWLAGNVEKYGLSSRVDLVNSDFARFFRRRKRPASPIGVYLYDGAHDYDSQLTGLLLARSLLADQAVIVVDDSNWQAVREANAAFVSSQPEARFELRVATPSNGHSSFWNGVDVLSWDTRRPATLDDTDSRARRRVTDARGTVPRLLDQGRTARDEGRADEALDYFAQAIARDPGDATPRIETARLLRAAGRIAAARDCLSAAATTWPTNPLVALEVAAVAELAGDTRTAQTHYLHAIELDPALAWAYPGAADALCESGRFSEAAELLDRALASTESDHPARPSLLQRKAIACLGRHQLAQAASHLAEVLVLTGRVSVLSRPLETLASQGEYSQALALLESLRQAAQSHLADLVTFERLFDRVLRAKELYWETRRRAMESHADVVPLRPLIVADERPLAELRPNGAARRGDIRKLYVEGDLLPDTALPPPSREVIDLLEDDSQAVSGWGPVHQKRLTFFLYEAHDCFLYDPLGFDGAAVIISDTRFLKDLVYELSPLNLSRHMVDHAVDESPLDSAFILPSNTGWSNYYHAVIDSLSSLCLYRRLDLSCPIVVPGPVGRMHDAILRGLPLPPGAVVLTPEHVAGRVIRRAYCPQVLRGQLAREWWIDLRAAYQEATTSDRESVVYVSREGSTRRPLTTEPELQEALRVRFDASIVQMETLTLEHQIRALRDARVIVGPHGAGLTNMIFSEAGATVVELIQDRYRLPLFRDLAAVSGHRYLPMIGTTRDADTLAWRIDADKVSRVIDALLTSPG